MEGSGFQGYMFSSLLINRKIQNLFCLLLFDIANCNCTDVKFILNKILFCSCGRFPQVPTSCLLNIWMHVHGRLQCAIPLYNTPFYMLFTHTVRGKVFLYKYSFSQHLDLEKLEKP